MRVADGDDQLAHAQALGVAELGGDEAVALGAEHARSESGSRPTTSKRCSLPSANVARPRAAERATTWADVSRKPSGVSTTALPAPAGSCPPRVRRVTRRLATDGASLSATAMTARE